MKKYKVEVSFREGVKDIQAEAILKTANANQYLGNGKIHSLKMGKWFIVECEDDLDINNLSEKLLANSVIEGYEIINDSSNDYEKHQAAQMRFDY